MDKLRPLDLSPKSVAFVFSPLVGLAYSIFIIQDTGLYRALLLGFLATAVMIIFLISLNRSTANQGQGTVVVFLVASFGVLMSTSAMSGLNWLRDGGLHVNDDRSMAYRGRALASITTPLSVIATVWAGTPAYYSNRGMVDILGKNDREIASRKPIGNLHPGHNKWDYAFSFGKLRPDVIFQLWHHDDSDLKNIADWGYIRRCHDALGSAYFLSGSSNINWSLLSDCPK